MGLYNFMPQFEGDILADKKRHTIRARRKYPDRPGSLLHLYVGLRRPGARLLKRRRCTRVEDVEISVKRGRAGGVRLDISIGGVRCSDRKIKALARADGFASVDKMAYFWIRRHSAHITPFRGDLIHWESNEQAARRG